MKFRELSKAEWHHIRTLRGQRVTGYLAHRVGSKPIPGKPGMVVGCGPTYFWPMGQQPGGETILKIMHKCPLQAAHLFLAYYVPGDYLQTNPPTHKDDQS